MPTTAVLCLLIDAKQTSIGSAFKVEIGEDEIVADLRVKVKEKKPHDLEGLDSDRLNVWKLSEPQPSKALTPAFLTAVRLVDEISENMDGELTAFLLGPETKISKQLWPEEKIHVLVQCPPAVPKLSSKPRRDPSVEDKRTKYQIEQAANAKAALRFHLRNGRPIGWTGPPIGLFHPAFHQFEEGLEGNEPIPNDMRLLVQEYIQLSSHMYKDEKERMNKIRPVLDQLLGEQLIVTESGKAQENGTITYTSHLGDFKLVILELRNEIGSGGEDPFFEAGYIYLEEPKYDELEEKCYFPTVLLAIAGPWICVGGAIYTGIDIAQPLTDYVYTGGNRNSARVERIFYCLNKAVHSLRDYYSTLSSSVRDTSYGSPFICEYDGRTFSYVERLSSEKEVYKVKEGDEFRVVKFVTQYCKAAHELLAEERGGESFAPVLRHVSTSTYGGRLMIVMDYVEGDSALDGLSERQFWKLEKALRRLHREGFVFGDLRENNILLPGENRVFLVDFDWCGKDGEATYPLDLNTDTIDWPDGVGPGLVMRKEHDQHMLEMLW